VSIQRKRTVMNVTGLKDARTNKFAHEYSGGEGIEFYQVILFALTVLFCTFVAWLFGVWFFGVGIGVGAGIFVANAPSYINTHNKHPKSYMISEVKRRFQPTLIIDDKRVQRPPVEIEEYVVKVCEFPNQ